MSTRKSRKPGPSAGPPDRIRLVVECEDRAAEVFIVNSGLVLVERGTGRAETSVLPGLYAVRVKTGTVSREHYVALKPGEESIVGESGSVRAERFEGGVKLTYERMTIVSAAPLEATDGWDASQAEAARRESRSIHVRRGKGAGVFVFIRHRAVPHAGTGAEAGLLPRLRAVLYDSDGKEIADTRRDGATDAGPGEPRTACSWSACSTIVDPGWYRLVLRQGSEAGLNRTVVACAGWQTQVFLREPGLPVPGEAGDTGRGTESTVLMAPQAQGFDPGSKDLRLSEMARLALAHRRGRVAGRLLEELVRSKFRDPMLGVLAGHLLLLGGGADLALLKEIVLNLRRLVGWHPDVEALALRTAPAAGLAAASPFLLPPMLLRSWLAVLGAAAGRPELVPSGSYSDLVSDRLFGDGLWLEWWPLTGIEGAGSAPTRAAGLTAADLRWTGGPRFHPSERSVFQIGALNPTEAALLDQLRALRSAAGKTGRGATAKEYTARGGRGSGVRGHPAIAGDMLAGPLDSGDTGPRLREALARSLGVPPASVDRLLAGLRRKLGTS
ncbi:MAG: hypothetical protein HYZ53_20705 [Planctomycetes bacterium]|nr:hypothetical protein [Planctomycetota bacterium]